MKKLLIIALVLVLALVAAPGLSVRPSAEAQEMAPIESVCLVTDLGRVNDGTFNQFAYDGMVQAVEEFELDSTFIETQAETDYAANIDTCVQEGYDAIVTVGFLIADATLAAAEANPETYFIGVDQFVFEGPSNYVGIQFREDQAAFLVGALAALVTETNTIGGVFGVDIPPVVRFRNGYAQGIGVMDLLLDGEENITLIDVYIDSFIAPDRGASAASQFIGEGADVLFGGGGPTGSGAITEGAQQGVWVIGVDQDEYFTTFGEGETPGADKIISSGVKRVDVGVYDMVAALAGNGEAFPGGGNYILDVANGGMGFAPANEAEIPAVYYEIVQLIQDAMAEGLIETGVNPETTEIEMTPAEIVEAMTLEIDVPALLAAAE
jgi:basic membrane lipoprotein Med (substrate-binding protein (PBP1-ABC) superfamily)